MQPSVTCYPIPGKAKARLLCEAFAAGVIAAGGRAHVCTTPPAQLQSGAAVFYGVRPAVAHLWQQAKAERRDWYYIDNSYFDAARERQFRITKNALQHDGRGNSDGGRFARLGLEVKPMRTSGELALVCEQSQEFMRVVAGDPDWIASAAAELRRRYGPDRVALRRKSSTLPLARALEQAFIVATWSSAAAIEALLAGVRVMCARECAAYDVSERHAWARVLADNQWTLDEINKGMAWAALNA